MAGTRVWLVPVAAGGAAMLLSYIATAVVLRYALARGMLDVPNQRSSHSVSTPRGGGLAIALVVLLGAATGWSAGLVPRGVAAALLLGGGLIAAAGWLDDRYSLPARTRMLVHIAAAAWAVFALHDSSAPPIQSVQHTSGDALAVVATVWLTNAYNFMDGIDGLAGSEGTLVGVVGGALLVARGSPALALVAFLVAGATAGFLVWNWPPARIFMGDVGSGFLGFTFAALAIAAGRSGALPAQVWALLLGVFLFDATVTLLRRVARGETWYAAHRSHAYQRLTRAGWRHVGVVGAAALVTLFLSGLATAAVVFHAPASVSLLVSLVLLSLAYGGVERKNPM